MLPRGYVYGPSLDVVNANLYFLAINLCLFELGLRLARRARR